MPTIYSVMTPKGGVGKTTSLTGLACYIAGQLQKKVLLVDLDNIASLTNNFQGQMFGTRSTAMLRICSLTPTNSARSW